MHKAAYRQHGEKSPMTPELAQHHNRLYERALSMANDRILLDEKSSIAFLGLLDRLKLTYAVWLFQRAIRLNPENWQAMWFAGKIYQRLRKHRGAFSWFERAYRISPTQPDVLREVSICAMELGRPERAIEIAREAVRLNPSDSGLQVNLALAYLLGNRIADSQAAITQGLMLNPSDKIALDVKAIIDRFARDGITPPQSTRKFLAIYAKLVARLGG
jgi:Flp pilus assembly protein TadD